MFQLSVVDHIRLSFATVAGAYERHADAAARLARWSWYVKISLVALLAEVHDQLLDAPAIAQRRDALVEEARACFEHAPPADRQTYDIARKALSGAGKSGYSEDEIDALLPASLRRPKDAPA